MTTGNDDKRRAGDSEDLPPSGGEARAQRSATRTPFIWLVVGLAVIAVFVFMISRGGGLFHTPASAPAPVRTATGA